MTLHLAAQLIHGYIPLNPGNPEAGAALKPWEEVSRIPEAEACASKKLCFAVGLLATLDP